jgi:hypothetical protein
VGNERRSGVARLRRLRSSLGSRATRPFVHPDRFTVTCSGNLFHRGFCLSRDSTYEPNSRETRRPFAVLRRPRAAMPRDRVSFNGKDFRAAR